MRTMGILAAALLSVSPAAADVSVTTVARYPHAAFLENMTVTPRGNLLFTSYSDRRVMRWTGRGNPRPWAHLDVHPVAVIARASDVIVTAHGRSFLEGAAFTTSQQFLVLGLDGHVMRRVLAPDARFLNGMVELGPDTILAADSILGKIWRFTPSTGAISEWFADPLLGQDPPSQRPGVNGLKARDGWLYFSNSARGALYRVRVGANRPIGAIELVATTGPIDDFAFLPDGSIAAATHGSRLLRIAPDGGTSAIMYSGCDGCTAVLLYRGRLLVSTTGNLLDQGREPARLLSVPLPTNE